MSKIKNFDNHLTSARTLLLVHAIRFLGSVNHCLVLVVVKVGKVDRNSMDRLKSRFGTQIMYQQCMLGISNILLVSAIILQQHIHHTHSAHSK